MNYSFKGWKSPAVRPLHVIPREEWWRFYAQADGGTGAYIGEYGYFQTHHVLGDFFFKDGKACAVENGEARELSLWR